MNTLAQAAPERAAHLQQPDLTGAFSAEELNVLHRLAHSLYTQGLYEDALRYFWFLSLHAPRDRRYLKGMGACLFMAKRFAEAVVVYSFLARLEPADPEVLCMCGHSLLMRGEVKDARVCLDYAAGLPDPSGEFHQRAKALLELISQA